MKQHLKTSIHKHVQQQSLSEIQLQHLLGQQDAHATSPLKKRSLPIRWATSFVFILGLLTTSVYYSLAPQYSLNERIGHEVAKNHIKQRPLEVQSANLQEIRKYFTELDFIPIESSLLSTTNSSLLGGRYCSIQGVTAAQLRFHDKKSGQVQSLYQAIYKADVFKGLPQLEEGKKPVTVFIKGLEVDIWVEKGLLFALTREAQTHGSQ